MVETVQNIAIWALQNLLWNIIMAAVGALAATAVVKRGLGYLKSRQNLFWFAGGSFVLLLAISFMANQRMQNAPNLQGFLEAVYVAQATPHFLVIIESVTNNGSMPSSAYSWRVSLRHGEQPYDCTTGGLPEQLNLIIPARGSVPQRSVTYYNKDSLVIKALSPIVAGGLISGILVCQLPDLDIDSLKEGDEVTVTFNDVFQKTHTASIRGSSKYADIRFFPGITQDIK